MGLILVKQLTVRGFIIFDSFAALYPDFAAQMTGWIAEGRIHYREEIVAGLQNAPRALTGLLRGENFGKRVIRLG